MTDFFASSVMGGRGGRRCSFVVRRSSLGRAQVVRPLTSWLSLKSVGIRADVSFRFECTGAVKEMGETIVPRFAAIAL